MRVVGGWMFINHQVCQNFKKKAEKHTSERCRLVRFFFWLFLWLGMEYFEDHPN